MAHTQTASTVPGGKYSSLPYAVATTNADTTTTTTNGAMTTTTAHLLGSAAATGGAGRTSFYSITVRHPIFKIGACLLFVSTFMFIVGFSVTTWGTWQLPDGLGGNIGLWRGCASDGQCRSIFSKEQFVSSSSRKRIEGWFNVVRIFVTSALVFYLVAVFTFLYQEVLRNALPTDKRCLEVTIGVAGALSSIGVIVFGVEWSKLQAALGWAFYVTAGACYLDLASAVLMGVSRAKHAEFTREALVALGRLAASDPAATATTAAAAAQNPQVALPMQALAGSHPSSAASPPPSSAGLPPSSGLPPVGGAPPPPGHVLLSYIVTNGNLVPVYGPAPAAAAPTTTSAPTAPPTSSSTTTTTEQQQQQQERR